MRDCGLYLITSSNGTETDAEHLTRLYLILVVCYKVCTTCLGVLVLQ